METFRIFTCPGLTFTCHGEQTNRLFLPWNNNMPSLYKNVYEGIYRYHKISNVILYPSDGEQRDG